MFDLSAKGWIRLSCGMAVILLAIAAGLGISRWNFLKRAVATQATITDVIREKDSRDHVLYSVAYVFTDREGRSVKIISSTASSSRPGEIGDKIEVLYDPADPNHSIQNNFADAWGLPVMLGGLGAFDLMVCGGLALFTGRRLKKQGEQGASVASVFNR